MSITDPITQSAFLILVSILTGTCLLMAVAIFRRWRQIRYVRFVHTLRRQYRPSLAKLLAGAGSPADKAALRELPIDSLEVLLDPLFSKRKLTDQQLAFLRALCAELGLIELWESRLANGYPGTVFRPSTKEVSGHCPDRARLRHVLRARSIRNLGTLRHRPSWPLLLMALDDRHPDIRLVALRALAAVRAPESFPLLLDRLQAVVQGQFAFPPLHTIQAALVCFDLTCASALVPSLRHTNHQIRMIATDVLRSLVGAEAAHAPLLAFPAEMLSPQIVELLLTELCADSSAEVRGRAAEVIVFLADFRALDVLRTLLLDDQWFVRLRTVRALAHLRQATAPLHPDIRARLRDTHWRVREAAARTLLSIGQSGKSQLYEHFLTSSDSTARQQIVEVIERTGLMPTLVEEYAGGSGGLGALMTEELASGQAPLGLVGVLRTSHPQVRIKFLDRWSPYEQHRMRLLKEDQVEVPSHASTQQVLIFPPAQAA